MILLLVAGIGVILAGVLAIGFGIPVKEFGFGNTLILTGTIGACTGLIMISLAIAVRELKKFAPQQPYVPESAPAPRLPKRDLQLPPPDTGDSDEQPPAEPSGPLFSRDQPGRSAEGGSPPPWQDEAQRARAAAVTPPAEPEEPKRRNLLFSSTRRERERAEADAAAAAANEAAPASAESAAPTSTKGFEDAWPNTERPRAEAFRRAARAPSAFQEPASEEQLIPERYVPPAPAEAAGVTVLKSGVVDGMSYSLYSDGSIEAQMPEGMMRFGSIDELRDHLDQRG